jgi:hypothetical protein
MVSLTDLEGAKFGMNIEGGSIAVFLLLPDTLIFPRVEDSDD